MPTKTVTTRTAAKKVLAKKTAVTKKVAKKSVDNKKVFVYADNSESFWLSDGQILNSLVALKDALATMDKTVFAHHVTAQKNDFAEWVEQVLDDGDCAKDLRATKTPSAAKTAVVKHLKNYSI